MNGKKRFACSIRPITSRNSRDASARPPCEAACVLGINEPPVTIKVVGENDRGPGVEGRVDPARTARNANGKRVAVVGSGPAGMAAAQQLNRAGHTVTLFEKSDRIGGLLRYGIPDFKMEKNVLDRRSKQMGRRGRDLQEPELILAANVPTEDLRGEFGAILLAGGAEDPRELRVPGRELKEFIRDGLPSQQNKRIAGDQVPDSILATGKRVVIIVGRRYRCGLPWHMPPAKRRSRCSNSRSCPCLPADRAPALHGRFGRSSCAPRARMKKGA